MLNTAPAPRAIRSIGLFERNLKLGYHVVHRGPIRDAAARVSLMKTLT